MLEEKLVKDGMKLFKVVYPLKVYLQRLKEIVDKNNIKEDSLRRMVSSLEEAVEKYHKSVIDFWKLYGASSEVYKRYYEQNYEVKDLDKYYSQGLLSTIVRSKEQDMPELISFLKNELDFKDVPELYSILKRDKLMNYVNNSFIHFIDIFEKVHKIYSYFERRRKEYLYYPLIRLESAIYSVLGNEKEEKYSSEFYNYCLHTGIKFHLISLILESDYCEKFERKRNERISKR